MSKKAKEQKPEVAEAACDEVKKEAEPLTPAEARKKLLLARLGNPNSQYTIEQVKQFKAELHAIKTKQWFPPRREPDGTIICWKVPVEPTNYDKFMDSE